MKYYLTILIFAAILFTGCVDANNPDCTPVDQSAFLEEYENREGYKKTDSGLIYKVIEMGDGEIPKENQYVFVTFTGKLVTGDEIDNAKELFIFQLNNDLLLGRREGLSMMREGSTYELVMPPELAFGNNPPPGTLIQCGAVVIYEITLDSFLRDAETFLEQNKVREDLDIEVTASGLQYHIIEEGEGKKAEKLNTVKVLYEGKLTNDYIFDRTRDDTPAEFTISEDIIAGFAEGLQLMNEGSKYKFFIPPNLAYGDNPRRNNRGEIIIPSNAVLVFEVEMVEVRSVD